jgi:hypothetical protein
MRSRLFAALVTLAAIAPPNGGTVAAHGARHKLHVSYGSAAVEGTVLLVRIRFFRDDLENALKGSSRRPDFALRDDPATEAAFLSYFTERFRVTVGGESLPAVIVQSGEDQLDREPVWWYALQLEAPEPIHAFRVRDTLLLELFADQRNIVKFVHFPEQKQKTYSFGHGEEEFDVSF